MSGAIGRTAQVLLSAGGMSSRAGNPIQTTGFFLSGFLSLALAVLKLTTMVDWTWWRVMLPLWVFLGHNAVYLLVGFICLFFARYGEDEDEEEQSIDETTSSFLPRSPSPSPSPDRSPPPAAMGSTARWSCRSQRPTPIWKRAGFHITATSPV